MTREEWEDVRKTIESLDVNGPLRGSAETAMQKARDIAEATANPDEYNGPFSPLFCLLAGGRPPHHRRTA